MKNNNISQSTIGGIYGMAFIGSLFYFLPQATTFWEVILGILKSLAWPALLAFNLFKFLQV